MSKTLTAALIFAVLCATLGAGAPPAPGDPAPAGPAASGPVVIKIASIAPDRSPWAAAAFQVFQQTTRTSV